MRKNKTPAVAAKAASAKLRSDALGAFLDDWEAKHGELTPDELARATSELTLPPHIGSDGHPEPDVHRVR
jgi:hypothetical protein